MEKAFSNFLLKHELLMFWLRFKEKCVYDCIKVSEANTVPVCVRAYPCGINSCGFKLPAMFQKQISLIYH